MRYVVLLRGINVGGKNKVPMATLRAALADAGFENVRTYIQSGNVLLESRKAAPTLKREIESLLAQEFDLDPIANAVLVLARDDLAEVIDDAPAGFGSEPDRYHYDVVFYLGEVGPDAVMAKVAVNPDVDTAVAGDRALYFRRLSSLRAKSRMSKLVGTPVYRSLTIRNWRTATRLLEMLDD
jgi:uncharacterized protein (DUF1697 family)